MKRAIQIAALLPVPLLLTACGGASDKKNISVETEVQTEEDKEDMASSEESINDISLPDLPEEEPAWTTEAVYLGVENYGSPEVNKDSKDTFRYRFRIGDEEQVFSVDSGDVDGDGFYTYPIQNRLKEGYRFGINTEEGVVTYVTELDDGEVSFTPAVKGVPGERTVANFLRTALAPAGTALYVYGGGWDWQDTGSSVQSTTLGVSPDWVRFFNSQTADYTYKNEDPANSFYPFGGYNEYYYAGLDCSGFLGWALYNTFETEDGQTGYVSASTGLAKRLSQMGYGSFDKETKTLPGDIISIKGHVWISLGTCADGSTLILHSTPAKSRTGFPGGGVELSAIGSSADCEAYRLAGDYMSTNCPSWYERYDIVLADPGTYFSFGDESAGRFSWATESGAALSDPEGIRSLSPEGVLQMLKP